VRVPASTVDGSKSRALDHLNRTDRGMSFHFDLVVSADLATFSADFVLLDEHGTRLAGRRTDFGSIPAGRQQALFDLQSYLRFYVELGREQEAIARTGVSIAEEVLGEEIFLLLWRARNQRTLRVRLPGATERENLLAAALARVPWEIARPAAAHETLAERNLLVRVVHDMTASTTEPLALGADECLRVLFVFAQARESRPLAARLERNRLRELLEREIYPTRRVVAHFLTHGVTRRRLEAQVAEHGGYHVVHWSGHGHLNLLELAKPGGESDAITGEELLELFVDAGGFIPRLFFLSACHSGDILRVKSWGDFLAVARGDELDARRSAPPPTRDILVEDPPGYTGTAHALLQGGVPSVVAMRYDVGDDYARELAVEFYSALLAHAQPKSAAAALTMARRALLDPTKPRAARFSAGDHATPVLYGEEEAGLVLRTGRSPGLETRRRRLHRVAELTTAEHAHFVGRTWELAGLGAEFIGSGIGAEVKPVAVVTGLGGMGKTALAAEALALWEDRFDWVLLYQYKGGALDFENTLRDIHLKLVGELGRYHAHVEAHRADAVFRPAGEGFGGDERLDRLTENLLRAMRDEAILLVLDNFETNLKPETETGLSGEPLWACTDPAWDRFLRRMAMGLVGTRSHVLVTCRHPLAALVGTPCHPVLLGPLSPGEAALYLRQHAALGEMAFGADEAERSLAQRLLRASRFHPLLMDRLARLATAGTELRPQLLRGLETLESRGDFGKLPELFATARGDAREAAYLDDALALSLDQLIRDAGPDARCLLWMISLANEPVTLSLLRGVWSGESLLEEELRMMKLALAAPDLFPTELRERLDTIPPELRAEIEAVPDVRPGPDPKPLLHRLWACGLVTVEQANDADPVFTCHGLVRERIAAWMRNFSDNTGGRTESTVRLAYADRLEEVFNGLLHRNMDGAVAAGRRALVYFVQAGAHDRLAGFAGRLVINIKDREALLSLLPHLKSVTASVGDGEPRWAALGYLADALSNVGRLDESLPYYEEAIPLARSVAEAGGQGNRQALADLAVLTGNHAIALSQTGDWVRALQRYQESTRAEKEAGLPEVGVVTSEIEALHIGILQGNAARVLPQVEERLAWLTDCWERHASGQEVSEAPDPVFLATVLISALEVASLADREREDWDSALRRTERVLEVMKASHRSPEQVFSLRMNRAVLLRHLGRQAEAQTELESCLDGLQNDPAKRGRVLSALAELFYERKDFPHAVRMERRALAIFEGLPELRDRAATHSNLAVFLEGIGTESTRAESARHHLGALIYRLILRLGQDLLDSLGGYAGRFQLANAAGTRLVVPRVSELLADPAFHPLVEWLRQRKEDVEELQEAVDQVLDEVRRRAVAETALDAGAADPGRSDPS
jgi:tetratricopeptide (TPR) repeat protein